MHFIDIIVLLVLVFVIYVKLKNILGTRPEINNREVPEHKAAEIFDILIKESEKTDAKTINKGEITPIIDAEDLTDLDKTLLSIPNFNKEKFMDNVKKAFEIILTAFSDGDTETLKELLNNSLFKKFKEIIDKRKTEGLVAETEFIGFQSAEIEDAKILKNIAKISVKFASEQVNILKNSKDEVIEGDANFIQNITDIWTFEKNISSTSPVWLLSSTKK